MDQSDGSSLLPSSSLATPDLSATSPTTMEVQVGSSLLSLHDAVRNFTAPAPDHLQHADQIFGVAYPVLKHVFSEVKKEGLDIDMQKCGLQQDEIDVNTSSFNKIPVKAVAVKAQKYLIDKLDLLLRSKADVTASVRQGDALPSVLTLQRQLTDTETTLASFETALTQATGQRDEALEVNRSMEKKMDQVSQANQELNTQIQKEKSINQDLQNKLKEPQLRPVECDQCMDAELKMKQLMEQLARQQKLTSQNQILLDMKTKQLQGLADRSASPSSTQGSITGDTQSSASGETQGSAGGDICYNPSAEKVGRFTDALAPFQRYFVTFNPPDDFFFGQQNINNAVANVEDISGLFHQVWTALQGAYPRQIRILCPTGYNTHDEATLLEAFADIVGDLMTARTTQELLNHLDIMASRVPPRPTPHKVKFFQQLPPLCPTHPMWALLWWKDKSMVHKHGLLAILSIYQPLFYRQVLLIESCHSRNLRKGLEFLYGVAESDPWTVALRLIIIICVDQSKIFTTYSSNKHARLGHAFTRHHLHDEFFPPRSDCFSPQLLVELLEFRPMAYNKEELLNLFAHRRHFGMFKELFERERERVAMRIADMRERSTSTAPAASYAHKFSSLQ